MYLVFRHPKECKIKSQVVKNLGFFENFHGLDIKSTHFLCKVEMEIRGKEYRICVMSTNTGSATRIIWS